MRMEGRTNVLSFFLSSLRNDANDLVMKCFFLRNPRGQRLINERLESVSSLSISRRHPPKISFFTATIAWISRDLVITRSSLLRDADRLLQHQQSLGVEERRIDGQFFITGEAKGSGERETSNQTRQDVTGGQLDIEKSVRFRKRM